MKHLTRIPLFLAMLFASSLATAASSSAIDSLMELSGLNKQVADIPAGVAGGVKSAVQQGAPLTEDQYAKVEKATLQAFQPEKITGAISDKLESTLSEKEVQKLLSWYQSDLGKKITEAEKAASNPAAYQEMISQAQTLLADKEGVKMAQRIDNLVNASEMSLDFQKNTAVAVYASLVKAAKPNKPVDIDAFKQQMAQDEPKMRQQIKQFVTLSFVYTYKDIEATEMEQYLSFLEQPATKKFNDNAINAMQAQLNDSVKTLVDSLGPLLTAKR